jgi:hypothetical protein
VAGQVEHGAAGRNVPVAAGVRDRGLEPLNRARVDDGADERRTVASTRPAAR